MDVSEICFSCKKMSDQMLMLSCIHDLCINCAASAFAQQVHVKGQNPDCFICQVCGQQTQLDASTILQLGNLAKTYIKVPSSSKISQHQTHSAKSRNYGNTTSPASKKKDSASPLSRKTTYYCKEHGEQEISYYCFGCQMNICPQCAIHGRHKDHDVKLMKKALNQVKGDYIELINLISGSHQSMAKYKDTFLKQIKQANDKNNRDKLFVARQFQNLRAALILKQKQILRNVEQMNKQNVNLLTGFLETINFQYEQINKVKKSIQLILRKDEVLIFQQYKKVAQFEEKVKTFKKKSDQINGQIIFLDNQSWQQIIKHTNQTLSEIKQVVKKEQVKSTQYQSSRLKLNQVRQT